MSFYTYYKYLGSINHCSKDQLETQQAEAEHTLELIKQDLVMLACATQPASGTIDLGNGPEPWMDYMATRTRELLSDLEDTIYSLVRYDQAIEVKERHPENIVDESEEIDEHWGEELE